MKECRQYNREIRVQDDNIMENAPGGYSLPSYTGGPCQYLGSEILQ